LIQELEALRDMLGGANDQQLAFRQKIALLEQALDRARKETERDRAFLIEQQDAFIVILVGEQEVELQRRDKDIEVLRERIAELEQRGPRSTPFAAVLGSDAPTLPPARAASGASSSPTHAPPSSELERAERAELERTAHKLAEDRERARETVQRLQAQRDEAQSAVARITKDRDDALQQVHRLKAELGGPRISTRPPSVESRRDSASFRVPSQPGDVLTLEGLELEGRLARPASSSQPGLVAAKPVEPEAPRSSSKPGMPAINSVLNPPRSNPLAASPLSTRLSPPPARISPPPARISPPPMARTSQPPDELRRALTGPPASSPTSSKSVLKQKPDPSTRPLVGYSMGTDSVEAEHLGGVRVSSRPPGEKR
jgi:hypothetical protein